MSEMAIFQQPRHSCEYCAESQLTPQGNGGTMGSKTLIAVGLIWLVVVALWLWLSPQQWGHIWLAKGTTKRTALIAGIYLFWLLYQLFVVGWLVPLGYQPCNTSKDGPEILPTTLPTKCDVLCDFRVLRHSEDASHISEAGDHARHRIVGMNLILQIDEALVPRCDERFKHLPHWHDAVSHRDLTLLALEIRKILHVYVE